MRTACIVAIILSIPAATVHSGKLVLLSGAGVSEYSADPSEAYASVDYGDGGLAPFASLQYQTGLSGCLSAGAEFGLQLLSHEWKSTPETSAHTRMLKEGSLELFLSVSRTIGRFTPFLRGGAGVRWGTFRMVPEEYPTSLCETSSRLGSVPGFSLMAGTDLDVSGQVFLRFEGGRSFHRRDDALDYGTVIRSMDGWRLMAGAGLRL